MLTRKKTYAQNQEETQLELLGRIMRKDILKHLLLTRYTGGRGQERQTGSKART